MDDKIVSHHDLEVYRNGFQAAMRIFECSKRFPREEIFANRPGKALVTIRVRQHFGGLA